MRIIIYKINLHTNKSHFTVIMMGNNCCAHFSFSLSLSDFLPLCLPPLLSLTHSVFYKDLWYSVAQSMWIKQEGLLLISKDYRKWAQSPIEHFQLEVQPLCLAGVQLSSYSLTRREMEIQCRYYITWYFPHFCFITYVVGRASPVLPVVEEVDSFLKGTYQCISAGIIRKIYCIINF